MFLLAFADEISNSVHPFELMFAAQFSDTLEKFFPARFDCFDVNNQTIGICFPVQLCSWA